MKPSDLIRNNNYIVGIDYTESQILLIIDAFAEDIEEIKIYINLLYTNATLNRPVNDDVFIKREWEG
jgi:hypothetical protein